MASRVKLTRDEVYDIIDGERAYQDARSLGPDGRTDGERKQVGCYLALIDHALNKAHESHYEWPGDETALEWVRKIAALAVQCMEVHGCPRRPGS